jgi:hypothetical protein
MAIVDEENKGAFSAAAGYSRHRRSLDRRRRREP